MNYSYFERTDKNGNIDIIKTKCTSFIMSLQRFNTRYAYKRISSRDLTAKQRLTASVVSVDIVQFYFSVEQDGQEIASFYVLRDALNYRDLLKKSRYHDNENIIIKEEMLVICDDGKQYAYTGKEIL